MLTQFEYSRGYWDFAFENPEKVSAAHAAIFFFAVEHCNRLGWKEKFGFPTSMAMEAIGIKKYQTYIQYFQDLCDWGFLILIQKSQNQYSSNIVSLPDAMPENGKALDKALVKHGANQTQKQLESKDSIDKQDNKGTSKPLSAAKATDAMRDEYKLLDPKNKSSISVFIKTNKPNFSAPYVDLWNLWAEEYKKPKLIDCKGTRRGKLGTRLKETDFDFVKILKVGQKQQRITEGTWFTFNWVIENDVNYKKVLEGNYYNKESAPVKGNDNEKFTPPDNVAD